MSATEGYRQIQRIGSNAAGTLYLAETDKGRVTIRQFESTAEPGSEFWHADRERFLEAGRVAITRPHPRIVPVLEVIDEAGEAFVASEYFEGDTLEFALYSRPFTPEDASEILTVAARALDFIHDRGGIHGDLKPADILLIPKQGVKLAEFGISPLARWDPRRPIPANLIHEYLSPEHLRDPGSVSRYSDQYSLAVIAYRMLTGQSPYGATVADPVSAILTAEVIAPSRVNLRLPASLDGPILRALDRDPSKRFGSCREFVGFLQSGLIPPMEHQKTAARPLLWVAAAVVALALLAIGIVRFWPSTPSAKPSPPAPAVSAQSSPEKAAQPVEQPRKSPEVAPDPKQSALGPAANSSTTPPASSNPPSAPPLPKHTDPVNVIRADPQDSPVRPPAKSTPRIAKEYRLSVLSRSKPIEEGMVFAFLDPELGQLAFGDLKAIASADGDLPARSRLNLQWSVNDVPTDSYGAELNHVYSYRNEPHPGQYKVTLSLDGHTMRTFSFRITP